MRKLMLVTAGCVIVGGSAVPAQAQGAYGTYFASPGSQTCYARTYTAKQLRQIPAQSIARIALGFGPSRQVGGANSAANFDLGIALQTRGRQDWYNAVAYCRTVGRAFDCSIESDGGQFRLAPAGRNSLRLTTKGITIEGAPGFLKTGATKAGYVINRSAAAVCTGARARVRG